MKINVLEDLIKDLDSFDAHIKNDEQLGMVRESLTDHIERTIKYFNLLYINKEMSKSIQRIMWEVYGECSETFYCFLEDMIIGIPLFHDIGKINTKFQKDLMKNKKILKNDELAEIVGSSHSLVSALIYLNYFLISVRKTECSKNEKKILRMFILCHSYIISRHHSNLNTINDYFNLLNQIGEASKVNQILRLFKEKKVEQYCGEFTLTQSKINANILEFTHMTDEFSKAQSMAFYIYNKLMYSILVAADYYATSEFMSGTEIKSFGQIEKIDQWKKVFEDTPLMKNIRHYQKEIFPLEHDIKDEKNMNILRTELLCDAEKALNENKTADIFYLEAPTGSGKSNTAIDLTFQLMESDSSLQKVFYIYPFNTLVEQNIHTLNKIFGKKQNIINNIAVINSLTPIKVDRKSQDEEEKQETGTYYQKALLNRQFLNYPLILSTHVTLFNTMFGNTKESVFGFHQLCNSIVILDEIQSYKNEIWGHIICFLKEFAKLLNIKIIIMSATLPNLDLVSSEMLPAIRLIKDRKKYFEHPCFKDRIHISYELLDTPLEDIEEKLLNSIREQFRFHKKILVEFIKKKTASKFFQMLKEDEELSEYTEYISGDDSIPERNRILERLDKNLDGLILISTQVIEAGVDIDMDIGYKNISKLDSEEQFMGRINRSSMKDDGVVYFFKIDDSKAIYGSNEIRTNKELTLENDRIKELLLKKNFTEYYQEVLQTLRKVHYDNIEKGLDTFFREQVGKLDFIKVRDRMELISDDEWQMPVYLSRTIQDGSGNDIDGAEVWYEYIKLLKDFSMEYSEKRIKLSQIQSKMNYFIHQVKKNSDIIYNDRVGELLFIEDGENYFENGKLNRAKLEGESGTVDFL